MLKISEISTSAPTDSRTQIETAVFKLLSELDIPYERVENEEAATMEECVEIDKALGVEIRKSVFLCNRQKTDFYLLVMPAKKQFITKDFSERMGCSRVSFASGDKMEEMLGVKPGSASIMALINDKVCKVQLVLDSEVAKAEWFGCNTGMNTSHIKIKTGDLLKLFIPYTKHTTKIISL